MGNTPKGFSAVTPYVVFDDAAKAVDFYKKALGAEERVRLKKSNGGVGHACVQIGDSCMMMSDASPQCGGKSAKALSGSPVSFYVYVDNIENAFNQAKAAGMDVQMEIDDTFWGDKMCVLSDPFGIQWSLAQHIKDVPLEEMEKAMKAF